MRLALAVLSVASLVLAHGHLQDTPVGRILSEDASKDSERSLLSAVAKTLGMAPIAPLSRQAAGPLAARSTASFRSSSNLGWRNHIGEVEPVPKRPGLKPMSGTRFEPTETSYGSEVEPVRKRPGLKPMSGTRSSQSKSSTKFRSGAATWGSPSFTHGVDERSKMGVAQKPLFKAKYGGANPVGAQWPGDKMVGGKRSGASRGGGSKAVDNPPGIRRPHVNRAGPTGAQRPPYTRGGIPHHGAGMPGFNTARTIPYDPTRPTQHGKRAATKPTGASQGGGPTTDSPQRGGKTNGIDISRFYPKPQAKVTLIRS
ncbi:hypothetical protein Ae201684_014686 [Aphanomyces euteiches]|uniref:RxLR effector protein n=1 Tax=Aphanomyces euteiches TaxID=100861 RepID=A0A6G0WIT8_9STRA|nr:hypothetical protein Ae201684_014686 [Aphanomyces euteiches]